MVEAYIELERRFGEWSNTQNVVACSSGTSALQLAIEALQLPKGSYVILPEFTMIACARAVTMAGLKPYPVDCNPVTLNMDPIQAIETFWSFRNVSAVMLVHIYGRAVDHKWFEFAKTNDIKIIEDLAEAHAIQSNPLTDAACWSFYRNKEIAGEEGGAVAFKDEEVAVRARCLRSQGFTPEHDFLHEPGGMNCRLSNANAELILDSLANVTGNLSWRCHVIDTYNSLIPKNLQRPERQSAWVYDLRVPDSVYYGGLVATVKGLNEHGIAARMAFKPISMQPEYKREGYEKLNAYHASRTVMYLPVSPEMTASTVRYNVSKLLDYFDYVGKKPR